jgi:hypothetical protein
LEAQYERDPSVVAREIAGEQLLVPIRKQAADMAAIYVLNETGARIWALMDGHRSLSDVSDILAQEYDVQPEMARADVAELVGRLQELGMLKVVERGL